MTAFAWGLAIGYVIAEIIDAIGQIRSAKRETNRKIAEARRSGTIGRGGHPSEKDIHTTSLPKLPQGPGPGSAEARERRGHGH